MPRGALPWCRRKYLFVRGRIEHLVTREVADYGGIWTYHKAIMNLPGGWAQMLGMLPQPVPPL
eukprot:2450014-Pyramimonas_sp.AAC.1